LRRLFDRVYFYKTTYCRPLIVHQQDDDLNVSAEKCGFNATLEL